MKDAAGKQVHALVDHLFRHQAGQMVASLTRAEDARHLDLAEEVVQEALVKALQLWPFHGVPENPAGWLVRVARNLALDRLRRDATLREKAPNCSKRSTRSNERRRPARLCPANCWTTNSP